MIILAVHFVEPSSLSFPLMPKWYGIQYHMMLNLLYKSFQDSLIAP